MAVIGLGFGLKISETVSIGGRAVSFVVIALLLVFIIGGILSYIFNIKKQVAFLISVGTAICGGSAIATVAPIIEADKKNISLSIAVVFILNAIALMLFPLIGQYLDLTQWQFGMWSAIAIHDTSSVVGSAMTFGDESLLVATTVKMFRVLWIIPISIFTILYNRKSNKGFKVPWFILLFLLAIALNSFLPISQISDLAVTSSKTLLKLTLFVIGSTLNPSSLKKAGWLPFTYGAIIWVLISAVSLMAVISVT